MNEIKTIQEAKDFLNGVVFSDENKDFLENDLKKAQGEKISERANRKLFKFILDELEKKQDKP